ncbi:7-cyano-7-deazaguanine synthase QueC [Aliidiomarina halalkaliphila]|uniref:7-cyano-7-deazaguanine synthase n=1 Tax=Aliidiomarina halalkaliphila TaxID=2593535 RepID=A0A552X362_9GAMM|nr:7-cyano-7-deazaguanine synthase QueC [Aliidiomarina halalkaliphila]TRW49472.1 7-cyano-7-deazaguanine synthase QueC [Aliidiomarina halalkaliphila]
MGQKSAVVIYSGGMDSFTVLNRAIADGLTVHALSFHYGQRHSKELDYAANVCEKLGISHKVVDIRAINTLLAGSALTSDIDVPDAEYAEGNMKATVVPNRNMILLSLAIGYAVSIDADEVYYGAHSGDHDIYPDCRPVFVEAMNQVSQLANYKPIPVVSPYLYQSKIDILRDGLSLGLDYSQTWTCYNGREKACGKCSACRERLQAFAALGLTDPLPYENA